MALHFGFFQVLWLGIKQGLMLVVLIVFASILPPFLTFQRAVNALPKMQRNFHAMWPRGSVAWNHGC